MGRISALQASLIVRIQQFALISLCHSSDRRDDLSRFACIGLSTKPGHLRFLALSANVKPSFLDYMVETARELPPLPPVSAGPPAIPDSPAEPLAEPAAQPAAVNQLISRFWSILLVLSFSYPLYNAFHVFSPTFGLFGLLASFRAYSTFHVSIAHNFRFSFASFC